MGSFGGWSLQVVVMGEWGKGDGHEEWEEKTAGVPRNFCSLFF